MRAHTLALMALAYFAPVVPFAGALAPEPSWWKPPHGHVGPDAGWGSDPLRLRSPGTRQRRRRARARRGGRR